jgi:hypothetical protein
MENDRSPLLAHPSAGGAARLERSSGGRAALELEAGSTPEQAEKVVEEWRHRAPAAPQVSATTSIDSASAPRAGRSPPRLKPNPKT